MYCSNFGHIALWIVWLCEIYLAMNCVNVTVYSSIVRHKPMILLLMLVSSYIYCIHSIRRRGYYLFWAASNTLILCGFYSSLFESGIYFAWPILSSSLMYRREQSRLEWLQDIINETYWLLLIGLLCCLQFASLVHDEFSHVYMLLIHSSHSLWVLAIWERCLFCSACMEVCMAILFMSDYWSRVVSDRADTVVMYLQCIMCICMYLHICRYFQQLLHLDVQNW